MMCSEIIRYCIDATKKVYTLRSNDPSEKSTNSYNFRFGCSVFQSGVLIEKLTCQNEIEDISFAEIIEEIGKILII